MIDLTADLSPQQKESMLQAGLQADMKSSYFYDEKETFGCHLTLTTLQVSRGTGFVTRATQMYSGVAILPQFLPGKSHVYNARSCKIYFYSNDV